MSGPELRTCSQCGNQQAAGDFCERCGGQLPWPAVAAPTAAAPGGQFPPAGQYPPPGRYPPAGGQPYAPVPQGPFGGGPGGYGGPPQGAFGGGRPRDGFFASLFDLSFHHFVTPKIIKVLFILALVGIGLGMLALIIVGFGRGFVTGILFLILALIGGFIYILLARLWLEVVVVLFRIEEHTGAMAEQGRK